MFKRQFRLLCMSVFVVAVEFESRYFTWKMRCCYPMVSWFVVRVLHCD
jgi:hypothetical protein